MALRKPQRAELLGQLALFEHCTKRDLGQLAAMTVEETFAPGAVLTREGQRGGLAYVVVSGSATARRNGRRIASIGPGSIIGELALIDGGSRTATVTADEEIEALAISDGDFRKLVLGSPRVTLALLRTLAERIRAADRRADARN